MNEVTASMNVSSSRDKRRIVVIEVAVHRRYQRSPNFMTRVKATQMLLNNPHLWQSATSFGLQELFQRTCASKHRSFHDS